MLAVTIPWLWADKSNLQVWSLAWGVVFTRQKPIMSIVNMLILNKTDPFSTLQSQINTVTQDRKLSSSLLLQLLLIAMHSGLLSLLQWLENLKKKFSCPWWRARIFYHFSVSVHLFTSHKMTLLPSDWQKTPTVSYTCIFPVGGHAMVSL